MNAAIIDASVVVRWLLEDDLSSTARALVTMPTQLIAPELLLSETANALWKACRSTNLPRNDAAQFLLRLPRRLEIPNTGNLMPEALHIAVELEHPVYDCLYLALAQQLDLPLLTLDARLIKRTAQTRFASRTRCP